jgi:hypothetical protein
MHDRVAQPGRLLDVGVLKHICQQQHCKPFGTVGRGACHQVMTAPDCITLSSRPGFCGA